MAHKTESTCGSGLILRPFLPLKCQIRSPEMRLRGLMLILCMAVGRDSDGTVLIQWDLCILHTIQQSLGRRVTLLHSKAAITLLFIKQLPSVQWSGKINVLQTITVLDLPIKIDRFHFTMMNTNTIGLT